LASSFSFILLSGAGNVIFSTLETLELGSVALSTPSLAQSHAAASILPNRIEVEVIVHKTFEQQQHGHPTATALMDDYGSGSSNSEMSRSVKNRTCEVLVTNFCGSLLDRDM
jgi:hypothetical protein